MPSVHAIHSYRGTPRACGHAYGAEQAEAIEIFLRLKLAPDAKRLRYAARCWTLLANWQAPVAEFVRGAATGAGRSLEELTLILLNDEMFHASPHCTALGATRRATRDGTPIIGENWDWSSNLYPWSSLTRLHMRGAPRQLLYSFPGLWAAAGINEHGLALLWTGTGYAPRLRPIVGIPTYALPAGVLLQRNCADALALLRGTRNAGSFNFFLADADGDVWVVEGCPGKIEAERCEDIITRANHYETERMCRLSKQALGEAPPGFVSLPRTQRMRALAQKHLGRITRKHMEQFLRDTAGPPDGRICDPACIRNSWIPVDSFYFLPAAREMWIARGIQSRHAYARHAV
ncbi:MAG: C45 family peptidase [Lentisphaerae bacterium]|nr:C45 family peptidase [Lentisphaerota bacterium]